MAVDILSHLATVRPDSGNRILQSLINGINYYLGNQRIPPSELIDPVMISNANWTVTPQMGTASLLQPGNRHAERKIMTLDAERENNFTKMLNTALLGGQSYPVLTTVLGIAGGFISSGGSLLFSVANTFIDVNKTSQRILARKGDQLWQVEEIGKVKNGAGFKAVYINSYWLLDPYRGQTHYDKGWLIHEHRQDLLLN